MRGLNRGFAVAAGLAVILVVACGGSGGNDEGGTPDTVANDAADVLDAHDGIEPADARDVVDGSQSDVPDAADGTDNPDAAGHDADKPDAIDIPDAPDVVECAAALPLTCGDELTHSTVTNGRANQWSAYNCTARLENGRETLYRFEYENDCVVAVTLSGMTTDIDLMRVPECDPWQASECSSTPLDIQSTEDVAFFSRAGVPNYLVVDGYAGQEGQYTIKASCDCGEPLEYKSGLAECAFQYVDAAPSEPPVPDGAPCLPAPCTADSDCMAINTIGAGQMCVMGNCVYCAQDTDCVSPAVCRAGRCVEKGWTDCPAAPDCGTSCVPIEMSETSCTVCVCNTEYFNNCATDNDCQVISHHPFQNCVSGRCADCRTDADCGHPALKCVQPGICIGMEPHPSVLYGAWLIGWFGGFNHFSYFRFEPDGTLRRAAYDPAGQAGWADDIFLTSCAFAPGTAPEPFVGTWEPQVTESGFLVINVDFQAICNPDDPVLSRWMITMNETGAAFTMRSVENPDLEYSGIRVPAGEYCNSEFTTCVRPDGLMF